jgi:hypothetical protein
MTPPVEVPLAVPAAVPLAVPEAVPLAVPVGDPVLEPVGVVPVVDPEGSSPQAPKATAAALATPNKPIVNRMLIVFTYGAVLSATLPAGSYHGAAPATEAPTSRG